MKRLWILTMLGIGLSFGFISCSDPIRSEFHDQDRANEIVIQPEALSSDNFWNYFVGTWQDPSYRGYIKFSVEVDEEGNFRSLIWHPASYPYHADHLRTFPAYQGLSARALDAISLYNQGRRLFLGTLLIPKSANELTKPELIDLQLVGKDPLSVEVVAKLIALLDAQVPGRRTKFAYYPVAEQIAYVQEVSQAFQNAGIAIARPAVTQDRVCYSSGWGVGRVRVIRQGELDTLLAEGAIGNQDILVLDDVPRELPVVAGIVVSQPSSPSSHPALLAGMLQIPFIYEAQATSLDSWTRLAAEQDYVYFEATGDEFGSCELLIRSGTALEADEASQLLRLKHPLPLHIADFDRTLQKPLPLDSLAMGDANKVGAKAAHVAELRRLIPEHTVKEGLALPIALFSRALETAVSSDGQSLKSLLNQELQLLLAPAVTSKETAEGLQRVRSLIEKARLDRQAESLILDAIYATFPRGTKIKLRSSSNVEDHPEFNGAGLYESKGACVGDDEKSRVESYCGPKKDPIIKSLLKVWASLYNLKAWVARRHYGIDESRVGMGVLVQRSYKGELANGVAISALSSSYHSGNGPKPIEVYSTGFPGEDLEVTNPPLGKVPETVMIGESNVELKVASTEVPRGRLLLADAMYRQLYELMSRIHAHYELRMEPKDKTQFKLDAEWKLIEQDGVYLIVIKQVRPVPMPVSSTQGLDRGTLVIGERDATLCPKPSEDGDGIARLTLGRHMSFAMGLHEVPLDSTSEMLNPVESLTIEGQQAQLASKAQIEFSAWDAVWGTNYERREYTVSTEISLAGRQLSLQWMGRQERALAQPRLLMDGVRTIWESSIRVVEGKRSQDLQVILGHGTCEGDAYQAFQPGSYLASTRFGVRRQPPRAYGEHYSSNDGSAYDLVIRSRTAFQGFDKTRFQQIEQVVINGLLPRPLVIEDTSRAVYAPAHHNFYFEYAFDLQEDSQLTAVERQTLEEKGVAVLLLRPVGMDGEAFQLLAVDTQGQKQILASLKLEERFGAYPPTDGI